MRLHPFLCAAIGALALASGNRMASGQIGGLGLGNGNSPLEVVARGGIEWDRANLRYIARGDARVTYDNNVVEADELVAHYRETRGGGTDIFRLDASGKVRIRPRLPPITLSARAAIRVANRYSIGRLATNFQRAKERYSKPGRNPRSNCFSRSLRSKSGRGIFTGQAT